MQFKSRLKKLESSDNDRSGALGWRIVDVPFDVKKVLGKGGTVPVTGTVNGFSFRTSLFPRKTGKHFLPINKSIQKGSGAINLGDKVEVILELDTVKRTVKTPELLAGFLAEDKDLRKYFDTMSYSMRKYMSDFITQAKSKDVQKRKQKLDGKCSLHLISEAIFGVFFTTKILNREPKESRRRFKRWSRKHRKSNSQFSYFRLLQNRFRNLQT
jgi:hypothetical protein